MKKLAILSSFVISVAAFAQGIKFEETQFKNLLEKAKKENKLIFLDAYTTWCGPCKMVAPILEELAEEYKDDIYIYKVDTEAEQELAAAFGIRSIPSILFCPMGEQPQMAQGALPKDGFKQAIDEVLLKKK